MPIGISRTYRTYDARSRAFGIGATHQFDIFLIGPTPANGLPNPYSYIDLIMPHGGRVHFRRIDCDPFNPMVPPGCPQSLIGARFVHDEAPGPFFHAKIAWMGTFWRLIMKDGLWMEFPEADQATAPTQAAVSYIV